MYYGLIMVQVVLGGVAIAKVATAQAEQFYLHEHIEQKEQRSVMRKRA